MIAPLVACFPALALDLDFRRHPRQFDLQSQALIHKSLASACLGLRSFLIDALPCSPSFLTMEPRARYYLGGYFSNGFTSLEKSKGRS